jgi:hypothetical protein
MERIEVANRFQRKIRKEEKNYKFISKILKIYMGLLTVQ